MMNDQRNLTARDMLRFQSCKRLLGCDQLTPEMRYQQARTAQRLRNFWTTATLHPLFQAVEPPPSGLRLISRTPAFSDPLIVTDLLTMYDVGARGMNLFNAVEVFEYGGPERSYGLDFFGLSETIPQRYIVRHEKNYSVITGGLTTLSDLQGRYVPFVPRLLAPYQQLEFNYLNGPGPLAALQTSRQFLQMGVRGVRCLLPDNPYSYFTESTDRDIRNYIANSRPETFFLEVTLLLANFPAVGETVQIKTPQMERPLLVLGATCNVEGVQAEITDEAKYYTFTKADDPLVKVPAVPLYKAPPLSLWAANSDFRNTNIYNMWAVPHLLERNTSLVIRITNGLLPDSLGVFRSTILTKSEQAAKITFICRTV